MYRAMGFAHATAYHHAHRTATAEDGQGTIEYIGLILLIAGVMAVVVRTGNDGSISKKIVENIKSSIDDVGTAKK